MKIVVLISLIILLFSCNYRVVKQNESVIVQKEEPKDFDIKGTWEITHYVFGEIAAMDDEGAKQWLNKKLIIDDAFHFNFQEIENYKDIFKGQNDCTCVNLESPMLETAEKCFSNVSLEELRITKTTLKVYEGMCNSHPLHRIFLTHDHRIIINWDGVFFVLTKTK